MKIGYLKTLGDSRGKVLLLFSLLIAITVFLFVCALIMVENKNYKRSIKEKGLFLTNLLSYHSFHMTSEEYKFILDNSIMVFEGLSSIMLYNRDGELAVSSLKAPEYIKKERSRAILNETFNSLTKNQNEIFIENDSTLEYWDSVIKLGNPLIKYDMAMTFEVTGTNTNLTGYINLSFDKEPHNRVIENIVVAGFVLGFLLIVSGTLTVNMAIKKAVANEENRESPARFKDDVFSLMSMLNHNEANGKAGVNRSEQKTGKDTGRGSIKISTIEEIGSLTGAVAHEFNNLLTSVRGYVEIMVLKSRDNNHYSRYLRKISDAVNKASNFTSNLLIVSKRQEPVFEYIDVNDVILLLKERIGELTGSIIETKYSLTNEDLTSMMDIAQIERLIINITQNAVTAMPTGGTLSISTSSEWSGNELQIGHKNPTSLFKHCNKGIQEQYIVIEIKDTGIGMDRNTMKRAFEPFFVNYTIHDDQIDSGAGLGLSAAYSIAKRHNGFINIESTTGKGSKFKVYIPLIGEKEESL